MIRVGTPVYLIPSWQEYYSEILETDSFIKSTEKLIPRAIKKISTSRVFPKMIKQKVEANVWFAPFFSFMPKTFLLLLNLLQRQEDMNKRHKGREKKQRLNQRASRSLTSNNETNLERS